ncbi:hypothetical protein RhiirA5_461510 [Rhizophagus irregularis]|uniref:Uncharacterized protein n=1 Tax=Rhizophagus irregularis TaxID=588596 RepID=A0A2N0NY83_9GLOM|nr:hypothetical protein RhiirA5_461510 [Rhizophagus irregularis]
MRQFTRNVCKSEWNHDHDNYTMRHPQLPLYIQHPSPKERPQVKKKNEIYVSEPDKIPFLASGTNSPGLIIIGSSRSHPTTINVSWKSNQEKIIAVAFGVARTKWRCDSKDIKVGIRELCGDGCLDIVMSAQTGYPNKVSNDINSLRKNNIAMQELPSLSVLVEETKKNRGFCELQPEHEWLIDQENKEYFNDAYGITDINPLLEDNDGMSVLFLDSRGILFEWCKLTQDMYILGINEMGGFANIIYHPEKKCIITKDTGEIIPDEELECQAEKSAEAS